MADGPATPGRPIICFVHVPKTAGSTVNRVLRDNRPGGMEHAQPLLSDPEQLRARIDEFDWLSAHMPYGRFRSAVLGATDRPRHFYTLIRTPGKQVLSHYNWLIEIAHRSPAFYDGHPPVMKEISATIRQNDNSDPYAVIKVLRRYGGLFLNAQSRFVVPLQARGKPDDQLRQALKPYRHIATQAGLPKLIKAMCGVDFDPAMRVNTARYHFDPGVFETIEVRRFLKRFNAEDERLYSLVAEAEAVGVPIGRPGAAPSGPNAGDAGAKSVRI